QIDNCAAYGAGRGQIVMQLLRCASRIEGVGFTSDFQSIAASTRSSMIAKASARPGEKTNLVVAPDCDLGYEVGPQIGNLGQCEPTKRRGCHLFGIGSRLVDVDVENQLIEKFTST